MAAELPTVSEAFEANVAPFVAGVQLMVEALHEAAGAVEDLQRDIDALHGKTIEISVETAGAAGAGLGGGFDRLRQDVADINADLMIQNVILEDIRGHLLEDAGAATVYNLAIREAAQGTSDAGAGAAAAAASFRILGTGLRLTGAAIHWVVAAGAEFLAVAIPAAVALGSALLVAAQGAQMVQQHMSALYTATEATANMFHQTIGSALGLRSALQQAQNAANPIVFSVLGGVINIVKSNFQDLAAQGLDVMRIFQTFTARVVADFQSGFGDKIHGLLAGMVTDLVMFGQVLGNVGHALINFAAAMPGLAEVLLRIVDGVSQLLLWVSQLPPWLITVAMAMEEFWRWGGLLATILTRIPVLLTAFIGSGLGLIPVFLRLGEVFRSVLNFLPAMATGLGVVMSKMTVMPAAFQEAGASIALFGTEAQAAVTGLSALEAGVAGLAAIGLGFLIFKAATARTAIQQLGDSMQQAVDKAQGGQVFGDITSNLAKLSAMQAEATATAVKQTGAVNGQTVAFGKVAVVMSNAAGSIAAFNGPMQQQQRDLINSAQAVTFLSHTYGVSWVGALELGTQAGVQWDQGIGRMSAAADINRLKVLDLMAGYKAMGQSAGAVGADMTAIAIQAGLQSSKIQQLTQAWDAYMSLLTGGTNSLATFEQGLQNIGTVAASSAGTLFEAQGKMNASTKAFAASLASFTGKGAQNWQNFNQVVTTGAEGFINWMQTAGAVGAVSGAQMSGAIKGVVAQLIPFASHSLAARAELAGLAAQTGQVVAPTTKALEAWAKGGMSARELAKFVQDATAKLSDMNKVASALGNVLQNDLVAMFDKAKLAASGLPGALEALSNNIRTTGMDSQTTQGSLLQVIGKLQGLHQNIPTVTALLNSMGYQFTEAQVKAIEAAGALTKTGNSASTAGGQMHGATSAASALAGAINSLHSKTISITTYFRQLYTVSGSNLSANALLNPGHATGTDNAPPGWAWVGERGPELMHFGGGEQVLSNPDSRRFMTSPAPAAGGNAGGLAEVHSHININLDGQQIFNAIKTETARYGVRNGNPQQGRLAPGRL